MPQERIRRERGDGGRCPVLTLPNGCLPAMRGTVDLWPHSVVSAGVRG